MIAEENDGTSLMRGEAIAMGVNKGEIITFGAADTWGFYSRAGCSLMAIIRKRYRPMVVEEVDSTSTETETAIAMSGNEGRFSLSGTQKCLGLLSQSRCMLM